MKEITILSGKGGTGKTSITASLASVAKNAIFCDNDVDAADLHLILQPTILEKNDFFSGWQASINTELCTVCNDCVTMCRFGAIHLNKSNSLYINPYQCEGCRLCERICPAQAISSTNNNNNFWYVSSTRFGTLVHADMGPGEENSGKLVTKVRKKAKELALKNEADYIINDGPPGIGCATIASLSGTNSVLLVIEPTTSSLHDVRRLVELIESFKIKSFALINKYDINESVAQDIELFLNEKGIPLLAKIPFDEDMVRSMTLGETIIEFDSKSIITPIIKEVWKKLKQ